MYYGRHSQHGHGIGSLFRSVGRMALPFLKSIGSYFGRQALNTGVNIGNDMLAGQRFKDAASNRLGETTEKIFDDVGKRLQGGQGRKRKGKKKKCVKSKRKKIKTVLD